MAYTQDQLTALEVALARGEPRSAVALLRTAIGAEEGVEVRWSRA
mgnify:CR=1 FL=1